MHLRGLLLQHADDIKYRDACHGQQHWEQQDHTDALQPGGKYRMTLGACGAAPCQQHGAKDTQQVQNEQRYQDHGERQAHKCQKHPLLCEIICIIA